MFETECFQAELAKSDRLLNLNETAAILRVSMRTLSSLVRQNKAPVPIKIGRQLRWSEIQVLRWLSSQYAKEMEIIPPPLTAKQPMPLIQMASPKKKIGRNRIGSDKWQQARMQILGKSNSP